MKKLDTRLIRTISQSKGQFISVAVIVAVALCIYMLFNMTAVNLKNAVNTYYELTNFNDIHAQLVKIPQGAIDDLQGIDGIKEVQGRVSFDVPLRVKNEEEKVNIRLISLPEDEERINILYRQSGHFAKLGHDNVILLEQFAKARNIKTGDIISPFINGRVHQLTVSEIASSAEFVYLMENEQSLLPAPEKFGVAFVSEEFAQSVYGYRGSFNELLFTINDQNKMDDIVDHLENSLDKYGVKRIVQREDQLSNSMLTQEVDGIEKMAKTIPILFLLVAAIIIFIMLSRIVQNDRMGIGVLKALGYGNMSILMHYTKYALAIGLFGSIVGIGSGILLSGPMLQVYALYFNIPLFKSQINYFYTISALLLTAVFCITSGILGARPVLHIMPADSMRPEAPKSGKRIMLEKVDFIWRRLSFSWKMVIRNTMRTKARFVFLVLGLSLSYAINTVPLFEAEAFPKMFTLQYGEYQKMDYNVEFTKPMNKRVINEISHLIEASKIEPKLEYPFELKNGWRKKTVSVIGIPRDTSFYKFENANSKQLKLPEKGLFITEGLAKTLQVNQGDKITVNNFIPGKKDLQLEVSGIIKQYLGANAYMDLEAMEGSLVDREMITGVSVASQDNIKEDLKDIKNIASVNSIADIKNSFLEYMDMMIIGTRLYLLFGGLLGFAIVYNATIITISERSMEFASLRVMGFDKKDIFRMVGKENSLMTGVAILMGIPLGMGMIKGIVNSFSTDMMTFPMMLTPNIFIYATLSTILFVIIAQLAGRKKIYKLNFIDAIKSRIS